MMTRVMKMKIAAQAGVIQLETNVVRVGLPYSP